MQSKKLKVASMSRLLVALLSLVVTASIYGAQGDKRGTLEQSPLRWDDISVVDNPIVTTIIDKLNSCFFYTSDGADDANGLDLACVTAVTTKNLTSGDRRDFQIPGMRMPR